jgi:hypothetical protein
VTCRDMDDAISSWSGDSLLDLEHSKHLTHCGRCRALTVLLDNADVGFHLSERLLRRVQAGILEDLKPVRPLPPPRILLLASAIVFLSVVAVGALLLGTTGWHVLNMLQRTAVFVTLAASAVLLANSMVRQMVPGSKHAFAPATLPIAILIALTLLIVATFRSQRESAFILGGLACMKNGVLFSVPAAFLLWLILRRGALLLPKLIGAAAGGLAGLSGLSVLEVNCPNLNVFHILVWHGGVVVFGSLGGALVGAAVESIQRWRDQKSFLSFRLGLDAE